MDGSANGSAVAHDQISGRFTPGHSEYRAKRDRINRRVLELSAEYEANTPVRQIMLGVAAVHLDDAARARTALTRTRATNAAARILKTIPRKAEPEPPPPVNYVQRAIGR